MVRQDREQGMRWRKLILPFLLPIVAVLLLLYLLSPNVAAESDIPLLKMARSNEEIRASSHANSFNLLCHTCALSVENTSLPQTVPPGDSANYELSVENTGDCTGTLTLTSTSQRGWDVDVIPPSPITLPVGSPPTAVTLTHTVPTHEPGGTVDVVTVTAVLDCRLPCGNCDEKAITLTTTVREFGVELEPDRSASAAADDAVRFTHALTNTGNYTDVFGFKATSTLSSSISIPATTSVEPFSSTIIPVTIVVSPSAKKGQVDTIVITATSMSDSDTSDYVIDQIEVITSGCDIDLSTNEPIQSAMPGESVTYTLMVSNVGAYTGIVGIETDTLKGWPTVVISPAMTTLPPQRSDEWLVKTTIPSCTFPSEKEVVDITATLDCPSCGDSDEQAITLTTMVGRAFGVTLEPDRFASAAAGETVLFTHALTNTGNYTDDFWFKASLMSSWPITLPITTTVGPCGSTVVSVSVAIPLSAEKGQTYTIVVTATSMSSPSTSDHVIDQIEVITRCCEVALDIADPVQFAKPGETVTYTLTVSNLGAHAGIASIKTDAPEDWSPIVLPLTRTLLPGEPADWLLSLTVPSGAYPGISTTNVTAVLTCTATQTDTAPGTVTTIVSTPVALIEPGTVKTIPVTKDVISNGTVVTFTHTVTNIGNLADTFTFTAHSVQEHLVPGWSVTWPGPEENMRPNESRMVTFSVTIPSRAPIYSDTIVITATPVSAYAHSDTATDRIRDGRVFLPIVIHCACPPVPLCNGDFEAGDLSPSWHPVDEWRVTRTSCPSGGSCALLGRLDYGCSSVPTGAAWLEQTFSTPSGPPVCGHPHLSFHYEIHTREYRGKDSFEVYLYERGNRHRILKIECKGNKIGCVNKPVVISGTCDIDLVNPTDCYGKPIAADFLCTDVTLRFENWNRDDNWYNTWTYIDDVEYTW